MVFRNNVWLIIAAFLTVSLIVGTSFFIVRLRQLQPVEIIVNQSEKLAKQADVYVEGAVVRPGIYPVKATDTLTAIISSAGLSDNADFNHLKIFIPYNNETKIPQKVNLNSADVWLLQALPGIGEGKAKLIVDYRQKNGLFRNVYDLLKIEGFGKSIVDKIRDLITVGD